MASRSTPWGVSDSITKLKTGISFVTTSGHGGYMIAKGFAQKNLSPEALQLGEFYNNYYCYEEDCLYAVVEFDLIVKDKDYLKIFHPADANLDFQVQFNAAMENLINVLSSYYPDYLIVKGFTPEKERYQSYLEHKESDKMRAEKHPDLIISAIRINDDVTKVTTADDKDHFVTAKSYEVRNGINLLSKCTIADIAMVTMSEANPTGS